MLLESPDFLAQRGIVRFEVRYPTGAQHEVELSGTVAVLGRDPSCDLVLNDAKCSRRHAVLEAGPQGIAIRDAGSANGTFVNGRKIERANLAEGDVVRLGEVILKVLPEDVPGTLMMAPEDIEEVGGSKPPAPPVPPRPPASATPGPPPPRVAAPPQAPVRPPEPPRAAPMERPQPGASGAPAGPIPRPLTISVLAALWLLGALADLASILGLWLTPGQPALVRWGGTVFMLVFALVSVVMGLGLWNRRAWARVMQIALAALGLLTCVMTLASAIILIYMLRGATRVHFAGRRDLRELPAADVASARQGSSEGLFTLALLACTLVPVIVAGIAALSTHSWLPTRSAVVQASCLPRVRAVVAAQEAFRTGTCGAYADLDGLLDPANVIPHYPASAPAFLGSEFAAAEDGGCHYELTVEDPVPPADGCPERSFRSYAYVARPLAGSGQHLLVTSDGVIHAAEGRPATPSDPPVR